MREEDWNGGAQTRDPESGAVPSDESLVRLARAGDRGAFAALWQRHARSGILVARQFTSSLDADDLVSEAYVRIYQRVLAGGGPDGAFRPYLYATIRNLAARWGRADHSVSVDDLGDFEDATQSDDPSMVALDRTLTVTAFRSLPERWRSVLWYTEVEGMDPHEVAPLLGISANGVAALAYRAREGLRKAWLQAHVSDAAASGECAWTIARLGDYSRRGLTPRDTQRVDDHLATCVKCSIISEEVDEVGSHLAFVLVPLIVGGSIGGAVLASMSAPSGAVAAEALASAMPPAFQVAAISTAPVVSSGLVASAVTGPLVGALSVALAVSGGLAVTAVVPREPASATSAQDAAVSHPSRASHPSSAPPLSPSSIPGIPGLTATVHLTDTGPGAVVGAVGSAVDGTAAGVGTVVDGVIAGAGSAINAVVPGLRPGPGPASTGSAPGGLVGSVTSLELGGTGMPGATVSVQAGGVVYATTRVSSGGTWSVHISAWPSGIGAVSVRQTLVSLLGLDLVTVPLTVLSNSLGVTVDVLGL